MFCWSRAGRRLTGGDALGGWLVWAAANDCGLGALASVGDAVTGPGRLFRPWSVRFLMECTSRWWRGQRPLCVVKRGQFGAVSAGGEEGMK